MLETVVEPSGTGNEKALLAEWARGNRAAGEALLQLVLPGLYGLCLRILKREADAEEAAQETLARLCARVGKEGEPEDVRKWVATVAMNLCFDRRRLRAREVLVEPGTETGLVGDPLDGADVETLRERIRELPERYQIVLHHHFVLDLKPRQIAEALGLPAGATRMLLHRAIAALRKKVQE